MVACIRHQNFPEDVWSPHNLEGLGATAPAARNIGHPRYWDAVD
jgi:hypothetical protein